MTLWVEDLSSNSTHIKSQLRSHVYVSTIVVGDGRRKITGVC